VQAVGYCYFAFWSFILQIYYPIMFLSPLTLCAEGPVMAQAVNKSVSRRVGIVSILAGSYEVCGP
jgi:hypothetical protein